ncbi:MAG TPA: DUF308 domain-containing protein [Chloroflexota bacterium]|nr:DUF308 domain-containing protein [Chloroflexota bacterium]
MVGAPAALIEDLARAWWLVALRGALAIAFAVLAFFWPGVTVTVLLLLFGAYALVDGIFAVGATINAIRTQSRWWPFLVEALLGIGVGAATFLWPGVTALALLYLIAAWAIATGIFEILAAIELRKAIEGEWMLIVAGALSVVFGLLLIFFPGAGALAVLWMIAAYALLFGILLLVLAFRLRGLKGAGGAAAPAPGAAPAL